MIINVPNNEGKKRMRHFGIVWVGGVSVHPRTIATEPNFSELSKRNYSCTRGY